MRQLFLHHFKLLISVKWFQSFDDRNFFISNTRNFNEEPPQIMWNVVFLLELFLEMNPCSIVYIIHSFSLYKAISFHAVYNSLKYSCCLFAHKYTLNAPAIVGGLWFHGLFAFSTQCKLICIHEYAESHIRVIATEFFAHCVYANEISSIVQTWISRKNTVETEYVHLF